MTPIEKETFIKEELYHELCCLLEATTTWQIYKENAAGCEVSIAMDSAFLHARNLFIFFAPTSEDKKNKNNIKMTEFGPKRTLQSLAYSQSKLALNRHLFHLSRKRLDPVNVKNSGHINEKVQLFADEILRLWQEFEKDEDLGDLREVAEDARLRAIQDAHNTAESRTMLVS